MNKIKVYIDWNYNINAENHHNWINSPIEECEIIVSVNRRSAFEKNVKKVLWLLEPEAIEPELYKLIKNTKIDYNFVVSHREDMSINNSHIIIYPCIPSWINKDDRKIFKKTKNISMIASTKIMCSGHQYRQQVAKKLSNTVEMYGNGRSNRVDYKLDGLREYRFSIAMENSCADLYFTEKILDCFFTGTIPIYWGTRKILNIFNPQGIIMLENFIENIESFDYEKEYDKRHDAIMENFEIAKEVNFTSQDGIHKIIEKIT